MGDIDMDDKYTREQFIELISWHIRSQRRELRQARLMGDQRRRKKAASTLRQFKIVYFRACNWVEQKEEKK
ncbi:MAG: hypothetical protein E7231_03220 [Cellulosilyticum sp.]|nr:hypothetical protein [Cellulosilyticum sp.]